MTQMNSCVRQEETHRHREQTGDCQGGGEVGEGWTGRLGLGVQAIMHKMGEPQDSTVQHRKLYSISCDNP